MPEINLTTFIVAPVKRVFDLSRSIDLHLQSTAYTNEKAIAGKTSGLIEQNETVTWQAYHFFKTRQFTSLISAMQSPSYFKDEMTKGDFENFEHQHFFKEINNGTMVIDKLNFSVPYGFVGKMVNYFYLNKHLNKLLVHRNAVIKEFAETDKWQTILH